MVADTASSRSLIARIAAHESWANTRDRTARTAPARAAMGAKFLKQADGDPVRAGSLRKAYFARLALRSAQARRKVDALTAEAEAAEAELESLGGDAA